MSDEIAEQRAAWIAMKHVGQAIKGRDVAGNLASALIELMPHLGEPQNDEEREILAMAQRVIAAADPINQPGDEA